MKNLLEEAARISNLAETSSNLLDSGSFDTTLQDFAETANDAATLEDSAADGAILAEPTPLELEDIRPQWETLGDDEPIDSGIARKAAAESLVDSTVPVRHRMPSIVRVSPYLCVLLAVASSAGWLFYLDVANSNNATTLGAALLQTPRIDAAVDESSLGNVERFPFVGISESDVAQVSAP